MARSVAAVQPESRNFDCGSLGPAGLDRSAGKSTTYEGVTQGNTAPSSNDMRHDRILKMTRTVAELAEEEKIGILKIYILL